MVRDITLQSIADDINRMSGFTATVEGHVLVVSDPKSGNERRIPGDTADYNELDELAYCCMVLTDQGYFTSEASS